MLAKHITRAEAEGLIVLGDHQRILLSGADTGGAYTLIEQCNVPGVGTPMHVHEREDEVFHVVEGTVEFQVNDDVITATAGDTVYVSIGVPHRFTFAGETESRMLLSIFPAGIEVMFRELSALPAGPPDIAAVTAICGRYGVRLL